MIIINILALVLGFVALIKGAGWFVDGSSALARRFHVPGVVIGLTVVALGTSAPELAVSISAALQGSNEIAVSNVVGSNTFNLLCVLGICAIIYPVPVDKEILKRDFPLSILITVAVLLMTSFKTVCSDSFLHGDMESVAGNVGRGTGIILLAAFLAYLLYLIRSAKKTDAEETAESMPLWKCAALILVGLALIVGGGQAVVYGAKGIARIAGMSETLIGLTIVAIGTSLPELVTSAVAAKKGETGLAFGNVIGSNIFNLLLILGLSAAIHPIAVNLASVCDMLILIAVSLVAYAFSLSKRKLERLEGVILAALYLGDVVFAVMR